MSYKVINDLLIPNIMSRPQSKMLGIRGICYHWVANPKSTAKNNRDYFNNLRNQTSRYASSHEIIGLGGEVIVCIPPNEVAYHAGAKWYTTRARHLLAGSPNRYLYGIEVCHPDWDGKYNPTTYKTAVERGADLLIQFGLKPSRDTIWRHHDVTGKDCPRYYIKNPREWDKLIQDITKAYNRQVKGESVADKPKPNPNPSEWAKEAWRWSRDAGLMDGSRPREPITRQEMATILYRLLANDDIAKWAEDAVIAAKELEVTDGSRMGSLATRQEAIKMIMDAIKEDEA